MEPYPTGALHSFIAAVIASVIALIFHLGRARKEDKSLLKQTLNWLSEGVIVKVGLLAVTFIAVWLAIRAIGLNVRIYFFEEEYRYQIIQVLDIVAYVLIVNLCMTLLKSTKIERLVNATAQSILVALLIFLPRAASGDTKRIYGVYGSAAILVGFSVLLISIAYVMKLFPRKRE